MVTLTKFAVLILCFVYVPAIVSAFFKRNNVAQKRFGLRPGSTRRSSLNFKKDRDSFGRVTVGEKHSSIVLDCKAGGSPGNPTIHWLKDDVRISQGSHHSIHDDSADSEDHTQGKKFLRMSTTASRLYLDCLTNDDEGVYTCVAETPTMRITRSTVVKVEKSDKMMYPEMEECFGRRSLRKATPVRIYMSTVSRLEYEGSKVQLFCRAEGYPEPSIIWYDPSNNPIFEDDKDYRITKNGDLIVRNLSWLQHMGSFRCEADNGYGQDDSSTFVYPTAKESPFL